MNFRSLEKLFLRFRGRADGAALAEVFDATAKELFEVACHLVRDPSAAEDLVQATFLTAIRKADHFDGKSPLRGWLYGILWHEAAKHRRSAARRLDPRELTVRESIDPSDELEAAEVSTAIHRALDELPPRYRDVLLPLVREGKGADDIARDLGRSPGTVRSQIHRGMQQLRRALPAGLASSPVWIGGSMRGLEDVRSHVLKSAGSSSAVKAASAAAVASSVIGGVLMTKTVVLGAGVLLATFAAGWFGHELVFPASRKVIASTEPAPRVSAVPTMDVSPSDAATRDSADGRDRTSIARDPTVAKTPDTGDAVSYWLARFNEKPDDWSHGLSVAFQIAKLDPDEALRIMSAVWPSLTVPVKEQVLKPFVLDNGSAHVLPILHLAATDPSLSVQKRAFAYLRDYALRDFSTDYGAYLEWAAKYKDLPLARVLSDSAQSFVADLLPRSAKEIGAAMKSHGRLNGDVGKNVGFDMAAELRKFGGLRFIEACLQSEDRDAERIALEWSASMRADETWVRTWILPTIGSPAGVDSSVLSASLRALSRPSCGFARDPILEFLRRSSDLEGRPAETAAQALSEIGDPAAIPAMIEIILHDKSGKLAEPVGDRGLARMTGVKWNASCTGEWWLEWWNKNQKRFSPEVAAIPIRR